MSAQMEIKLKMNMGLAKTTTFVTRILYLPLLDHVLIKLYEYGKDKD